MRTPSPAFPAAYRRAAPGGCAWRGVAALLLVVALVTAACGDTARTRDAPVITVVTGLWPLAQAISEIGQENVRVVDVVPDGQDPRTWKLNAAEIREVRTAGVVVEVGTALQPSLARVAAGDTRTLTLRAANPYVWLDPYTFESVGAPIRNALDRADPKARGTFANGYDNFEASLSGTDTDFQTTLGDCPRQVIYTVDPAFTVLNSRYQVRVVPIQNGELTAATASTKGAVAAEEAGIRRLHVKTLYNQIWSPYGALLPAQQATGVTIASRTLDPLLGVPPGGFPKGLTDPSAPTLSNYTNLVESNLQVLVTALGCPNPNAAN